MLPEASRKRETNKRREQEVERLRVLAEEIADFSAYGGWYCPFKTHPSFLFISSGWGERDWLRSATFGLGQPSLLFLHDPYALPYCQT